MSLSSSTRHGVRPGHICSTLDDKHLGGLSMRDTGDVKHSYNGVQRLYSFQNGWKASVIRHDHSYGHDAGLWELAVLDEHGVRYDSGITDDVIGWLSEDEVDELLDRI